MMSPTEIDNLVKKWDYNIDWSNYIFTWTEPHCLAYLCEHASKAANAIEVGVYMGRGSKVMLDSGLAHLWAIDPFMIPGTQKVTEHFLRSYLVLGQCEIIPKHTKEAAAMLQHMAGKIDFIFIDDGHAYEDVVTDIACMLPLLRSGGILCGHDYETNPVNDVARAVRDLLPGHTEPVPRLWSYTKP